MAQSLSSIYRDFAGIYAIFRRFSATAELYLFMEHHLVGSLAITASNPDVLADRATARRSAYNCWGLVRSVFT
jgi:hypothetical protein